MQRLWRSVPVAAMLLAAGCASPPPTAPDAALAARQAQCRNLMYENRRLVGRGPPNWNLYDYCMRGSSVPSKATGGQPTAQ
jgi:hypothetical protein